MAKAAAKPAAKPAAKTAAKAPKKTTTVKKAASSAISIDKVCEEAVDKLRSLGIHEQLQADIEWCLGSYRADGNPVGLYSMAERVLAVFKEEKARKNKLVTAKNITDVEKAIAAR